jgi:hypothetical protein
MAKGEIPIGYIIALVLGIAVVAILGYWFFVMQGSGGAQMTASQCQTMAYTYCRTWQANLYQGSNPPQANAPNVGAFISEKWFAHVPAGSPDPAYAPTCDSIISLNGDGKNTHDLQVACDCLLNPGTC